MNVLDHAADLIQRADELGEHTPEAQELYRRAIACTEAAVRREGLRRLELFRAMMREAGAK